MGLTQKISISVSRQTIAELRELLAPGITLTSLVNESLEDALKRFRLLKLLKEWDREDPPTPAELQKAKELWRAATE